MAQGNGVGEEIKDEINSLPGSVNMDEFGGAFNAFMDEIRSQYFQIDAGSKKVVFFDRITADNVTEDVAEKLTTTNYEIAALRGEEVVLFDKPYFVDNVTCASTPLHDEKSNVIKLLSLRSVDKKIIPKEKASVSRNHANGFPMPPQSLFVVRETVLGFILPRQGSFTTVEAVDFEKMYADKDTLNVIGKKFHDITTESAFLQGGINKNIDAMARYMKEKSSQSAILNQQIDSKLKEKERLENSVNNENKTLQRITKDIDVKSAELDTIQALKDEGVEEADSLVVKIKESQDNLKSELADLNEARNQISDARNEKIDLEDEITKLKADINVTTLDMKGFSGESKSQLERYFWLALAAFVFLAVVFYCMYDNAQTFKEFVDSKPTLSTWDILLSRLPLITATTLVIGTLSALLFYLVNNLVSVSNDKMNMLKASVLAEQITGSLPKSDMTSDEIRDYKRNTKIELVMSVFANKSDKVKDEKQMDFFKQFSELVKALKS